MDERMKRVVSRGVVDAAEVEAVLAGMVAMITALAELDGGWMPRSMLYIAMGTDLAISEMAIQVAERAGYVTATAETVAITNEGREKAAEIERALERRQMTIWSESA